MVGLATTHLDLWIEDSFYDFQAMHWRWGASWWANGLIHVGGIRLVIAVGVASLAAALYPGPVTRRWAGLYLVACILLGPGLVRLGKEATNVDCPRQLARYGRDRAYVPLFEWKPDGAARGSCFPGGHSSGAFAFLGFFFLARRRRPRLAPLALVAAASLGATYAFGQWARGAHFPSHDVASALVCGSVALGLDRYFGPRVSLTDGGVDPPEPGPARADRAPLETA